MRFLVHFHGISASCISVAAADSSDPLGDSYQSLVFSTFFSGFRTLLRFAFPPSRRAAFIFTTALAEPTDFESSRALLSTASSASPQLRILVRRAFAGSPSSISSPSPIVGKSAQHARKTPVHPDLLHSLPHFLLGVGQDRRHQGVDRHRDSTGCRTGGFRDTASRSLSHLALNESSSRSRCSGVR